MEKNRTRFIHAGTDGGTSKKMMGDTLFRCARWDIDREEFLKEIEEIKTYEKLWKKRQRRKEDKRKGVLPSRFCV